MKKDDSPLAMSELNKDNAKLYFGVVAVILIAMIFAIDLQIPLGVAVAVPYVAVVLLGLWAPQRRFIIVVALTCSVLTYVGFLKSPTSSTAMWQVIANRSLSLFVIWVTAALCFLQKKKTEALSDSENRYHTLFEQLRYVIEGTTRVTGESFLHSLVYHLAAALKTRYVFICEIVEGKSDSFRIRAFYSENSEKIILQGEHSLKGSPCEEVFSKKEIVYFARDVHKFPDCFPVTEARIDSYLGYPLFGANGEVVGILVLMHDKPIFDVPNIKTIIPMFITRAEVEMARERAEQRLKILFTVVEQSPATVVITDTTGKISYVNPSFTRTTGYTLEEVIGNNPRLWKSGMHPPEFYQQMWETILAGKEWRGDICNKKKNGDLYWELLSILHLEDAEGNITHFIAIKVDDTERRRAEQKMEHYAAELERSNQALKDFAAIASHDLQEPLRKVTVFGGRLRGHIDNSGSDYLDRMLRASVRMQSLIDDLLEYSRVAAKPRIFEPTDLQTVVSGVLSDLEILVAQTGAKVEVGSLPTIEADEIQMRQLFQNLIANALKFQRKKIPPVVTIQCHYSEVDTLWTITVEDNGIGFDQKYAERIFKPFERLHGRSEYEGSGIGLAVCQKIILRHGGTIKAESDLEKGTKFIITLPSKQIIEDQALHPRRESPASS